MPLGCRTRERRLLASLRAPAGGLACGTPAQDSKQDRIGLDTRLVQLVCRSICWFWVAVVTWGGHGPRTVFSPVRRRGQRRNVACGREMA
jgi:hypothetical protein